MNTIRELFPRKPGYGIIYNLLEDPTYSELQHKIFVLRVLNKTIDAKLLRIASFR